MGNRKFGSFVFLSWALSGAVQAAVCLISLALVKGGRPLVPEPGPFFFVFSLLPLYYSTCMA
jgi:hypothetical protein